MERGDGLVDDVDPDPTPLVGLPDDEAVIAKNVDASRDPARVLGDSGLSPVAEEVENARARHTEAGLDIVAGLLGRQRRQAAPPLGPPPGPPKLGAPALPPPLWAAHEPDLQEPLPRRLKV